MLFSVDSMGCPPWVVAAWPEDDALWDKERDWAGFGLVEMTVGLNVTVRWGLVGAARLELDMDDTKGVVSVACDAMTTGCAWWLQCRTGSSRQVLQETTREQWQMPGFRHSARGRR